MRAAVDRVDLRTHVVVMIFARRSLEPTRVTLRPLPFRYAHTELCVDVRSRGATLPIDFAFTVVSVKKRKASTSSSTSTRGSPSSCGSAAS